MTRSPRHVLAVLILPLIALGVAAFILGHQPSFSVPSWVPFVGDDRYVVYAEFTTAQAVAPGQGQPVTIAGVPIGLVGKVTLHDGRAVVRMDIDKGRGPVYRDARIVLRPRTPLKDMYLALDPGTRAAGAIPDGGTLSISHTQPDVNEDEFLAALDGDTRSYLQVLLQAAGTAVGTDANGRPDPGQVTSLRSTLRRFAPLARDSRRLNAALKARRGALRSVVHNYGAVAAELGRVEHLTTAWVQSSNQSLGVLASNDDSLRDALSAFPPALDATRTALRSGIALSEQTTSATRRLQPFARAYDASLRGTADLSRRTTGLLRDRLRPAVRRLRPSVRQLAPATSALARATPGLEQTVSVLRDLFQATAYNPPGGEEGYLFWSAWLAHIGASVGSLQDANGPVGRSLVLLSCPQLDAVAQIEQGNPTFGGLLTLSNLPDRFKLCPNEEQAKAQADADAKAKQDAGATTTPAASPTAAARVQDASAGR